MEARHTAAALTHTRPSYARAPPQTALDDRFLETLLKIRRRDPSIYQPGAKLLTSSSDDDDDDEAEKEEEEGAAVARPAKSKKKPVYLRDVQAQQLLERAHGGSVGDESDSGDDDAAGAPRSSRALGAPQGVTYAQEQEEARRAFLAALSGEEKEGVEGDDDGGGLLVKKKGAQRDVQPLPTDDRKAKARHARMYRAACNTVRRVLTRANALCIIAAAVHRVLCARARQGRTGRRFSARLSAAQAMAG